MLSLLAVFAISAMASAASAQAAQFIICKNVGAENGAYKNSQCEAEGGSKEWERFPILADENIPVEGTGGELTLKINWAGVVTEIRCAKDAFSGALESGGRTGAGSISFKECRLYTGEKKCKLTSPEETEIPATFNEAQLEEEDGRVIDRFEPVGATNTWLVLGIEKKGSNSCTIEGSYKITGSQYCEEDKSNSEAETFKEQHELICTPSGSELYIGSREVTVTLWNRETVKLSDGGYWAIRI